MSLPKNVKQLREKIEVEKDFISAMPRNNEKNNKIYEEKLDSLFNEYTNYKSKILENMQKEYDNMTNAENPVDLENLDAKIAIISSNLYLLNDYKTSYEKMELDKLLFGIRRYYKDNLDNVNSQILECIMKFSKVGIELSSNDFNYSLYVNQYMQVFLKELKKDGVNSLVVKQKFEELYWKCPDILIHIELNIRNIYLKNKQQIDKYFEKEKNELLKKMDKTPEEILNIYNELKKRREELIAVNPKFILNKFLLGKLKMKDFEEAKLNSNYKKILSDNIIKNINSKETQGNIIKFLNTLYEYRNYLKFKYIIDDIKNNYKQKEMYKKNNLEIKKKIADEEKILNQIRKKMSQKTFFWSKKDNSNQLILQNQKILEIEDLYKKLDLNEFYNKICNDLTDSSTVYEALHLAESYHIYVVKCVIDNDKDITKQGIDNEVEELHKFLENPNHTIINNLTALEDKDVGLLVKDRYRLLDFKIEKEDVSIENLDNLISILENIVNSFYIKIAKIDMKDIDVLLEYNKILK